MPIARKAALQLSGMTRMVPADTIMASALKMELEPKEVIKLLSFT